MRPPVFSTLSILNIPVQSQNLLIYLYVMTRVRCTSEPITIPTWRPVSSANPLTRKNKKCKTSKLHRTPSRTTTWSIPRRPFRIIKKSNRKDLPPPTAKFHVANPGHLTVTMKQVLMGFDSHVQE